MPQEDLRDRLLTMHFSDRTSFPSYPPGESPMFTLSELSREPIKWLKYLVMDRVGLESIDKIASQINRFSISGIDSAKEWVHQRFETTHSSNMRCMIVAKVVPWDCGAQLKNYRMFSLEDIEPTFRAILDDFPDAMHELWCCESSIGKGGFNLGGRLTFPKGNKEQFLELVWFASPRLVESFQLPDFEFPYLRAVRNYLEPRFSIEILHIPNDYNMNLSQQLCRMDFHAVAHQLAMKRRAMEVLISILYEFGAGEVSFCFKITDGRLTIIDWDTEIESSTR